MDETKLEQLRYRSEGTDLDFKQEQYKFVGAQDHEKAEMLKDILAFANAWREGTAYILVGLKDSRPHPAEVTGITQSFDDAALQQFVNGKLNRALTFSYEEHLLEGKTVGVFAIPKQKRPFFLKNHFSQLKGRTVYIRQNSSTAEATIDEIAAMGLDDIERKEMHLELNIISPKNEPVANSFDLEYLQFPEKLPDFEIEREPSRGGIIQFSSIWHANRDFWREYAEYAKLNAASIEMKFVLNNRSASQLTNAKLEIYVEPLDGQKLRMLTWDEMPDEPKSQYNHLIAPHMLDFSNSVDANIAIDESPAAPLCQVRFGSLLPGEEGKSDVLVLVPSGPGRFRLKYRILGAELPAPHLLERTFQAVGEVVTLDATGLDSRYSKALYERYTASAKD